MALNISFGVSTWLWTSPFSTSSIWELFPKIAAMGFDVVEIALEDPGVVDVNELKKGLKEYNLEAQICGAFGPTRDLTHVDPSVHKNCLDYIEACLNICAEVEAKFFGL